MASRPITSWQIDRETMERVTDFFFWIPKSLQMVTEAMKLKDDCFLEARTNLDSILKDRDFPNKCPSSQSFDFSSSHVWMWELDYKESWALKHWCFRTVVLEKTLESPLDCKESQPVNPKGNQSWICIGRTDGQYLATWWKELTHWKIPWCWQEEKGTTEDEMAEWHHQLNGHEFE